MARPRLAGELDKRARIARVRVEIAEMVQELAPARRVLALRRRPDRLQIRDRQNRQRRRLERREAGRIEAGPVVAEFGPELARLRGQDGIVVDEVGPVFLHVVAQPRVHRADQRDRPPGRSGRGRIDRRDRADPGPHVQVACVPQHRGDIGHDAVQRGRARAVEDVVAAAEQVQALGAVEGDLRAESARRVPDRLAGDAAAHGLWSGEQGRVLRRPPCRHRIAQE